MANKRASLLLRLLELREQQYLRARGEAVAKESWSRVSGYDGIAIGLQIAQGMVKHEFNLRPRRRRTSTSSKEAK